MTSKNIQLYTSSGKPSLFGLSALEREKFGESVSSYMPLSGAASLSSQQTNEIMRKIEALKNQPSQVALTATHAPSSRENTLEERLFDARANVKILTSAVAMYLEREWREKLFYQIDLLHDPEEWEAEDEPINQSSFKTFLRTYLQIIPKRRPGLGLSYMGNLIAAWTTGRDRLTIEFLPDDNVRWVVTKYFNDEPERGAGQSKISRLLQNLAPYNPECWFSQKKESDGLA